MSNRLKLAGALGVAVAMLGGVTFAGATGTQDTFSACVKSGKIDPGSIRVGSPPKCPTGWTIVSWDEGSSPAGSLDALAGTPCRQGTPAVGTLELSYAQNGAVTLTCASASRPGLTVSVVGSGSVTSTPTGVECGQASAGPLTDCAEPYPYGTDVVLSATATTTPYSVFTGWSGACSNATGTCTVTMTEARSVTATFASGGTGPGADPSTCDPGAFVAVPSAAQLAAALGVCAAGESTAGLVGATIAQGDGTTLSPYIHTGVLKDFGTGGFVPVQGSTMVALSTGAARDKNDPGWVMPAPGLSGAGPSVKPALLIAGDPSATCPHSSSVADDPTLTLTLRAPSNATGFSFKYDFFSADYPEYLCTQYSDNFYVTMDPAPAGAADGNIAFDTASHPVTASSITTGHCAGCPLGTAMLANTGYDADGATGWSTVTAAVSGGTEFTVVFRIWDTSDRTYDSLVLLDGFQWTT